MSFSSDNRAARKAAEAQRRAVAKEYRAIKKHFRRVEESVKAKSTARIHASETAEKRANHKRLEHPNTVDSGHSGPHHARAARRTFRTGEGPTYQRLGGDSDAQRLPAHNHHGRSGHWAFIRTKRQSPRR